MLSCILWHRSHKKPHQDFFPSELKDDEFVCAVVQRQERQKQVLGKPSSLRALPRAATVRKTAAHNLKRHG
jgi:hypothetical protein